MKKEKRARLEHAGWKVGSTEDFLGLSAAESALIDIRVTLAQALRHTRLEQRISQAALAKKLGSSQSRVAKMESGDLSVSIDLLLRSLFIAGSTRVEIGRAIAAAHSNAQVTRTLSTASRRTSKSAPSRKLQTA
jgi:predicted XRE-type DNA-binding protein